MILNEIAEIILLSSSCQMGLHDDQLYVHVKEFQEYEEIIKSSLPIFQKYFKCGRMGHCNIAIITTWKIKICTFLLIGQIL